MKRYFTSVFLVLSVIILIVGLRMDFRWNGVVSWSLVIVCLIFAAYFTKYIPNKKNKKDRK